MLEIAKVPLDEIALSVRCAAGSARLAALGFGRDDGRNASPLQRRDRRVGVRALVGKECFRLDLIEQLCETEIAVALRISRFGNQLG